MVNSRLLKAFPDAFAWIRRNVLFQWFGLLASIGSTLALCAIVSQVLNSGTLNWLLVGAVLAALALRLFFNRKSQEASLQTSITVKLQMRNRLYQRLADMGTGYLRKWSTSEITQLTTEGVEQLETYFAQYIPQLFYALLAPLTLFVIVCFISWQSALVLLVCVPLIPVSIIAVQKFAKKLLSRYWSSYTGLSDSFLENLRGLTTLKPYQADGLYHEKMNRDAENFRKITMRVLIMQLNSISVMDLVAYGGSAAGILTALSGFFSGNLSLSGMLAIVLLSAEFFLPMRTLGSYFHISMNGSAAADKMFALLDEPTTPGNEKAIPKASPIRADHLSFSYPGGKEALKDVSFTIPAVGLTGIVGESGSGKSTLAGLLTRRLTGYEGELRLGDQPLSALEKASLPERIGLLGSSSVLFKGTVRENLQSAGAKTDEQMIDALKKTRIWDFLNSQGGLDFEIEEEGSNLSGGQKQRIAFARLLIANPPTLLLDESTSSVDAGTEAALVELIRELAKEKQVIFITHRLANIQDADSILVFRQGQLVETGTQNELLDQNGEFRRLYDAQKELEAYVRKEDLHEVE